MSGRDHRRAAAGRRRRLVRRGVVLAGLLAVVSLVTAASADADVMARYRTAYKTRLTAFRFGMDSASGAFTQYKQQAEAASLQLRIALEDGDAANIETAKQVAMSERSLMQDQVRRQRDAIYADINRFRATAAAWFDSDADKQRFKTRLTSMRAGFKRLFSADETLMSAFWHLGVNADPASANVDIMEAPQTAKDAEKAFDKALKLLRALL